MDSQRIWFLLENARHHGTDEVTRELDGWDVALWFAVCDTEAVV